MLPCKWLPPYLILSILIHPFNSELEHTLHSRIATASNQKLLQVCANRPTEQVIVYPQLEVRQRTKLYMLLCGTFGNVSPFKRIFRYAENSTTELGIFPFS